jgi:transglutaminase-like putative cysteine protease
VANLISQKFLKWTEGLGPLEARINIFKRVRDIPYAVIPETLDSEKGPEEMLRVNKGSCQPKHLLLGEMFERLGISVFYVVYSFRWDELEVDYPRHLKALSREMPASSHLACRARINDELVLVDATCDLPLERIGVPVNRTWDGFSDLTLPIHPLEDEEIYHSSERTLLAQRSFSDVETRFYMSLNEWLEEVRGHSGVLP